MAAVEHQKEVGEVVEHQKEVEEAVENRVTLDWQEAEVALQNLLPQKESESCK